MVGCDRRSIADYCRSGGHGAGSYLATRSDVDASRNELVRERREIAELPDRETEEIRVIFVEYGVSGSALDAAVAAVTARLEPWLRFMMKDELGCHVCLAQGGLWSETMPPSVQGSHQSS